MQNLFRSYYPLPETEVQTLWKNCTFVFDANVLLNFYAFNTEQRGDLLRALRQIAERIWIPNYVALEFQRNRLKTIRDKYERFSKIENLVKKQKTDLEQELNNLRLNGKHGYTAIDLSLEWLEKYQNEFLETISTIKKGSLNGSPNSEDELLDELTKLFENRVGPAPKQNEIDGIYSDGKKRFMNAIPPGFKDDKKENENAPGFLYGGVIYERKYGDLVIWKQITEYAKTNKIQDMIFITDDLKEDWWVTVNKQRLAMARPELVDELYQSASVNRFQIYSHADFLHAANIYLEAKVKEETIEAVAEQAENVLLSTTQRNREKFALKAVFVWLKNKIGKTGYGTIKYNAGFPDLIVEDDIYLHGFEVCVLSDNEPQNLRRRYNYAEQLIEDGVFTEITFVLIAQKDKLISENLVSKAQFVNTHPKISTIFGSIIFNNENEEFVFQPVYEIEAL